MNTYYTVMDHLCLPFGLAFRASSASIQKLSTSRLVVLNLWVKPPLGSHIGYPVYQIFVLLSLLVEKLEL